MLRVRSADARWAVDRGTFLAVVLSAIFFASGASALVFETLWFHQAGLTLGNSVWASALVLSGFMAGMGLGNAAAFRFGDRVRSPVATYALLEIVIAVTGVALVYGLPHLGPTLAPWLGPLEAHPVVLGLARFGFAFGLLLIPSTAMGLTLPLLTRALSRGHRDFGHALGLLYGWNTFGAVAGVLLAEHWLVGALGIRVSAWTAAAANLAAAALAGAFAARLARRSSRVAVEQPPSAPSSAAPAPPASDQPEPVVAAALGRWLSSAFVMGFCLLAMEVVWFRVLALYVPGYAESLATMLAVVLAAIAAGGLVASALSGRIDAVHRFAPLVAFAAGILLMLGYAVLPAFTRTLATRYAYHWTEILLLAAPLMLPVAFLSGVFYTLAGTAILRSAGTEARAAGLLTLLNTTGAAVGPLVAAFVLLPSLGAESSLLLIAVVYAASGAILIPAVPGPRFGHRAAALAFVIVLALFPFGSMARDHVRVALARWSVGTETELVWLEEGVAETVMYLERRDLGRVHSHRMLTNGFSMSGTNFHARRYMKLYVYLPIALHEDPKSALLISYGVGNTAKALTDTRSLEHIDVVDISPDVLEASRVVYPDPATHPLHDPRVDVHVEDGRYFLQTTERRYDLITSEPPPPRIAGVVNLYTREYYGLIRDRLTEGGWVTYWLPLHSLTEPATLSVIRAFCDVFEDCSLWHGDRSDLMLMGSNGAAGPVPESRLVAQWRDPVVEPELRRLGLERPEQLGALFIGGPEYLHALVADALPLVDDHPKRIMQDFEFDEVRPEVPLLAEWRRPEAARDRFAQSPLISGLWPEALRERSLGYFEVQAFIDRATRTTWLDLDEHVAILHEILTGTDLEAPVLWANASDWDIQRIVEEVSPETRQDPGVKAQLAVRALAERRYGDAARLFGEGAAQPELAAIMTRFQVLALCLAGEVEQAGRVAELRRQATGYRGPLPPFWDWLHRRYGVPSTEIAANP